jgi:hypothetical protein
MRFLFAAVVTAATMALSAAVSAETGAATAERWQQDPRVVAVRRIYQDVTRDLAAGRLQVRVRRFEPCEPYSEGRRALALDRNAVARRYERESASDDSFVRETFYYDERGRTAFLLVTANAVNGTRLEYRLYFRPDGTTLYEDRRTVRGPGYTFPEQWPIDRLVRDPLAAFEAKGACPERHDR